jgi:hypothetical protein
VEPSDPALRHYLHVLRRNLWLVVLVPVVALAAMGVFMAMQEPVHRASMTLVVGEARGGALPPVLGSDEVTRRSQFFPGRRSHGRTVIQSLGLAMSTREFRRSSRLACCRRLFST